MKASLQQGRVHTNTFLPRFEAAGVAKDSSAGNRHPGMMVMALMLTASGCATLPTGGTDPSPDWVCEAFRPITWSRNDTLATRIQIHGHNGAWDALCPRPL